MTYAGADEAPVFVAGATGYIGRSFLERFVARLQVIPVARRAVVGSAYPTVLFPDLAVPCGLRVPAAGATMLHAVGCSRESELGAIHDGNVESTRRLLMAAPDLGVDRIIYLSGYGIGGSTTSVYYQTKAAAEAMIRKSDLAHVILRCSYIVGGQDELTPDIQAQARRGTITIPGDGAYRIQPLLVDDVVEIIGALASTRRDLCGTFNLVGEAVTYRRFVADLAAGVAEDVTIVERNLAALVRHATLSARAPLSLSQVAILVADKIGERTRELAGVRVHSYDEVRRTLLSQ